MWRVRAIALSFVSGLRAFSSVSLCNSLYLRFADLLASAPPSVEGTRFRARLHSCACRPASIWLDTMPTSFPLTLSDSDFASSARLRLGLPAGPANAPALQCACGTTVLPGDSDHPLTCACLALQRTSRHDFVTTRWRRIAARAGVHTTAGASGA
jgi:hypothetical protein